MKELQSLGLAVELLHEDEGLASWGDEGNDTDLMEMDIDSEELLLTDTTDLQEDIEPQEDIEQK